MWHGIGSSLPTFTTTYRSDHHGVSSRTMLAFEDLTVGNELQLPRNIQENRSYSVCGSG